MKLVISEYDCQKYANFFVNFRREGFKFRPVLQICYVQFQEYTLLLCSMDFFFTIHSSYGANVLSKIALESTNIDLINISEVA
jgi:hypothetical protein